MIITKGDLFPRAKRNPAAPDWTVRFNGKDEINTTNLQFRCIVSKAKAFTLRPGEEEISIGGVIL
jgi:hypothetical protein